MRFTIAAIVWNYKVQSVKEALLNLQSEVSNEQNEYGSFVDLTEDLINEIVSYLSDIRIAAFNGVDPGEDAEIQAIVMDMPSFGVIAGCCGAHPFIDGFFKYDNSDGSGPEIFDFHRSTIFNVYFLQKNLKKLKLCFVSTSFNKFLTIKIIN
ncbi:hypothetical protein RFI_27365 [Reticulomyxa filosa]|uniref:Uncharacterized protein n=1 Tax=Reticulomyxa filosa TaxID=46433 RepID=X6M7X1_RETFI|nr:hypothetical protein RFI_27365 [Reticulomyxa filosa]|eukprot:ETO10009.1 hypothetical protein RFI_27365 [Reticulomyxa filosa]